MSAVKSFLCGDRTRYVLFPIRHPQLWAAYKAAHQSIWSPGEIDLTNDRVHWDSRLSSDEREFISVILGFFAAADGLIVDNLTQRFCSEVQIPEARCFYGIQMMIENVHAEVYSRFIQELVVDMQEQDRLFRGLDSMPAVRAKADWCIRWIEDLTQDFPTRLIAFAIVEGVFFSSSFAAMFWLRQKGIMNGLVQANALIARDEGMHVSFACLLYRHLNVPVKESIVHRMVSEAVGLEHAFFEAALPRPLVGMNAVLMRDYVEYVADFLLKQLGVAILFGKSNPFPFMETSSVALKTNFFERGVTDYLGIPPPRTEGYAWD
ncbi:putative ribonucleoside-diphosphate reductase small chain B [Earliella scabrosa]|nr:putative ribonucleoside-diphosphate reductase small chain B [Earliella scabrosa]